MKVVLCLCIAVVGIRAQYSASGWKPDGPQFTLPVRGQLNNFYAPQTLRNSADDTETIIPQQEYGAPQFKVKPALNYGVPSNQYDVPARVSLNYGPPANQYDVAQTQVGSSLGFNYKAPEFQFDAFQAPNRAVFNLPATKYGIPEAQVGGSAIKYGAPQVQFKGAARYGSPVIQDI